MFFSEIKIGDKVSVHTAWGLGRMVEGTVTGKEKDGKNDQDIIDYRVDGDQYEHWCYMWQILNHVPKEKSNAG